MAKIKMRSYVVTFERVMDVVVYCPEGTPEKEIEEIAQDVARSGDLDNAWNLPDWESYVSHGVKDVTVEVTVSEPNKYGYRKLNSELLEGEDSIALSDDRSLFVDPTDAKWIYAAVEQAERDNEEAEDE